MKEIGIADRQEVGRRLKAAALKLLKRVMKTYGRRSWPDATTVKEGPGI